MRFLKDATVATAIEYGLIAVLLIARSRTIGAKLSATFGKIAANL